MADNKMPSGKDPIVKPQSMTDKLQGLSNNVNAVSIPKITSAYNVGKAKDFSAKQNNLAKFGTYGSEIYGKLGFDPNKNMNEVYDAEMTELIMNTLDIIDRELADKIASVLNLEIP